MTLKKPSSEEVQVSQPSRPLLPSSVSKELEHLQPHQVHEAASLLVDAFFNDSNNKEPSPIYSWVFEDLLLPEDDQRTTDVTVGKPPRPRRRCQREALHWLFCKNLDAQLEHDAAASTKNRKGSACRCVFHREPDRPPKMICFFILSAHNATKKSTNNFVDDNNNCFGAGSFGSSNCFGSAAGRFGTNTENKVSSWAMIRHGILRFPILFGWKTFYRLLLSNDSYETITEKYVLSRRNNLELDDPSSDSYSYRVLERMAVHPSMHRKGIGSYFLRKALFSDHQSHDDTNDDVRITSIGGDCSKAVRNNDNSWCILQTDKEQNVAFFSKLGFTVAEKNVFEPHRFSSSVTTWLMVLSPIVAPTEAQ